MGSEMCIRDRFEGPSRSFHPPKSFWRELRAEAEPRTAPGTAQVSPRQHAPRDEKSETKAHAPRLTGARHLAGMIAALVLPADAQRPFLVARLFLAALIARNPLVGTRPFRGFGHSLLPAMLSTLVLRTFKIVLFRHWLSPGAARPSIAGAR